MIIDNRGLEPPQPMMRTLKALERVKNGDSIASLMTGGQCFYMRN